MRVSEWFWVNRKRGRHAARTKRNGVVIILDHPNGCLTVGKETWCTRQHDHDGENVGDRVRLGVVVCGVCVMGRRSQR
jgi:hypothetical protein